MNIRLLVAGMLLLAMPGCQFFPHPSHQPSVHNPFPQLSKVAIAPFFNLSHEPTVDGRQFAIAYFDELQGVPGYEVVPVGVVEKTLEAYKISLSSPADARKLAQILNVDAVVIGAVTDFSEYYPPRCAMQVEWYAANPNFHAIPPGYGLPWGTTEEEQIPSSLIFEAEMALARAQMKTQTPEYETPPHERPPEDPQGEELAPREESKDAPKPRPAGKLLAHNEPKNAVKPAGGATGPIGTDDADGPQLPPDWPDPRGFTPPGPSPTRPKGVATAEPVLRHTQTYDGADSHVTEALQTYYYFRDDARYNGWQSYLQREDDFIRFCCRQHIWEMLTARGGAGETRVVWRRPTDRYTP